MNSPQITLSFRSLALAQLSSCGLAAVIWVVCSLAFGYGKPIAVVGALVAGVTLIISIAFLALFSPQKERPIATIGTLWSGVSFGRFITALGASSLLYYVAHFDPRPELRSWLFSFLLTAIFLLITETKVISTTLANYSKSTE